MVRRGSRGAYVNRLELLAATLAVKSFAKDKFRISILLRIDNITAVAYINHLGGYSLQGSSQADKRPVDVVPGTEYPHHSTTPPGTDCNHQTS